MSFRFSVCFRHACVADSLSPVSASTEYYSERITVSAARRGRCLFFRRAGRSRMQQSTHSMKHIKLRLRVPQNGIDGSERLAAGAMKEKKLSSSVAQPASVITSNCRHHTQPSISHLQFISLHARLMNFPNTCKA